MKLSQLDAPEKAAMGYYVLIRTNLNCKIAQSNT